MNYRLLEVIPQAEFNIDSALTYGLDIQAFGSSGSFSVIANDYEYEFIRLKGIKYKVIIDDIEGQIESRNKKSQSNDEILTDEYFSYGSMGGFYTLEEAYRRFDLLLANYPEYTNGYEIIGYTWEERPIYVYSFGNRGNNSPEVLFTALHHGREPGSITVTSYFLNRLLDNAKKGDPEAQYLLENREIYIIPVVNPDGYEVNRKSRPDGGGMWRKNMRQINDSTFGVDPNRNYGPYEYWNSNSDGSTDDPKLSTYRGPEPFSEPETQAVRDFCFKHNFVMAINYHSWQNVIIYPSSATRRETADSILYRYLANEMSKENSYQFGRDKRTVGYEASGNADDWQYLKSDKKGKTISFTPEVGSQADFFWPPKERIYPQCLENYHTQLTFLRSAGSNVCLYETIYSFDENLLIGELSLDFVNTGLEAADDVSIILEADNSNIEIQSNNQIITEIQSTDRKKIVFKIPYTDKISNGDIVDFIIKIIENGYTKYDTVSTRLFKPEYTNLFKKDDDAVLWETESWGAEFNDEIQKTVFTDSPGEIYLNSADNIAVLKKPLDLTKSRNAELQFITTWDIDKGYDAGYFEISSDNGVSWDKIRLKRVVDGYSNSGTRHPLGNPGLTGFYPLWIRQSIDLENYLGKEILVRLSLLSDKSFTFYGWSIADFQLLNYDEFTSVNPIESKDELTVYPNPVRAGETVFIDGVSIDKLTLTNILGETITPILKNTTDFSYFTTDGISSGSYKLFIHNNNKIRCLSLIVY